MNDDSDEVTIVQPPESEHAMRLPTEARVVLLAGIFIILLCGAMYLTAAITLPLVLALMLDMLLSPAMRLLGRLRVPRALGAMLLIVGVFAAVVMLATALAAPAKSWAEKLPGSIPRLQERMHALTAPLETFRDFIDHAENIGQTGIGTVAVRSGGMLQTLFSGTASVAGGLVTMLVILYFLLLSGDLFLRRLVEILPRFRSKRQAVEIIRQIETNISAYLFTITLMNVAVGVATALGTWAAGLENPLLWGTLALMLNYIPLVGAMVCLVILLLAGLMTLDPLAHALLPAGIFLVIHIVEGQCITPILVARRFTLNPVMVILSLVFWNWMWGVPGAILAVPMLAVVKIVCDGIEPWQAIGHLLEGNSSEEE